MRAITIVMLLSLLAGCAKRMATTPPGSTESSHSLRGKTILMLIAHKDFRDEELAKPKAIFEEAGATVKVASSDMSPAKGMLGMTVTPDLLLKDAKGSDYDAIVYVGGAGASEYWDDPTAQTLAKDVYKEGKIVAAICLAPVTFANAGLLKDKKATVWPSESKRIEDKGAQYTGDPVTTDGRIVTGNGPDAAEDFAIAVVKAMFSR